MALKKTGSATRPLDVAYFEFNTITNNVYNFSVNKAAEVRARGIIRHELFLLVRYGKEQLDKASIFANRATPAQLQAYVNIVSPEITDPVGDWQAFRNATVAALDWIVDFTIANPNASYSITGGPYNWQTNTDYQYTFDPNLSEFLLENLTAVECENFALLLDAIAPTVQT